MGLIVDDPARRSRQVPVDPGQVGAAPGHLRRVRLAGLLLLAAIGARFFGFFVFFAEFLLGPLVLMLSSTLFLLSGVLAFSRPGRRLLAPGPGRWGLLSLALAEGVALATAVTFLMPDAVVSSSWDQLFEQMVLWIMPLHATFLVGAAAGLLVHLRRLLRPDARLRRVTTVALLGVIGLLIGWAAAIPLESPVLLVLSMLPLPFLAILVGFLMLLQQVPSRAQVKMAVQRGLEAAGAAVLPPEPLPSGARWQAQVGDRLLTITLDDARLPLAVEIRVPLAPSLASLRLSARVGRGADGVSAGDVMLDRLLTVEGLTTEHATALLADLHSEVLGVTQGRPGSGVFDGWVVLRASVGPGASPLPGTNTAQLRALIALVTTATRDAVALADALETRQHELSALEAVSGRAPVRQPESQ